MSTNKPFNRAVCGALFATGIFALLVAQAAVMDDYGDAQLWAVQPVFTVVDWACILTPLLIGVSAMAAAFALWDD